MSVWDNLQLPKTLFRTSSPYNGNIEVWQVGQTLKLVSDGTVQSVSSNSPSARKMVFGRMIDLLKEQEPQLNNVLIFGLAGGTMQKFISEDFPGVNITSVDIDPVMIDIAKNFFKIDEIPNHRMLCADACRVVVEPENYELLPGSFQAVIVDIFCGDRYPDLGDSGNFFGSLKRLLVPEGLAVFNRIYLYSHQDDVDEFIGDVSEHFRDVDTVTVAGKTNSDNILIYGRK